MISNYIKIAWRNLINNKLYSIINISGLAIGLSVCMMIMLYVTHEMSYDSFHKNGSRIFSPHAQLKIGGNTMNLAYMSYAAGPLIKQSQPTVEDYMRTLAYFKPVAVSNSSSPEEKFTENNLLFADPGFFDFFSFKLLSGSYADVLKRPFTIVLSRDMAAKYFGKQDPIGKTITLKTDGAYTYQITGVAENAPSNSSIVFNFVASNKSLLAMKEASMYVGNQQISFGSFNIYLLLKHTADTARLISGLNVMAKKEFDNAKYSMISLPDTHLKNSFGDFSNIKYLKIFPLVAVLILLLALVNYMSLSTARATIRAKEIGVRKVAGAGRKTIALQFYIESAVFTCISFIIGYLLCYLITPYFLNTLQLKIDNSFLYGPLVLGLMFALLILTLLIAGSYPSLVLSAFKPIVTLKGKMSKQTGGVAVRKIFTTLQFAIAIGLITCGIIIDRQLYFFRHADIGINRDNVVMIPIANGMAKNYPSFKQDVSALAGVSDIATSNHSMFKGYSMFFADGKLKGESVGLASFITDTHFMTTLGLHWKYAPVPNTDLVGHEKVILNEAAVAELHLPANPIGSYIQSNDKRIEVIGVLKNFNFSSMSFAIKPMALNILKDDDPYYAKWGCNLFARINPHINLPGLINNIKDLYKKYGQDAPFNYTFMDDAFNAQYKAEDRLASIFSIFTYLTMILASLGLFGLATFTIQERSKEISIRKILGAGVGTIASLLSKNFIKLVLLAVLIASPIAWWAMHSWLQNFTYRITISWWMFALAGGIAILIALITISFQSIKAALVNPIKSLRSE